MRRAEIGRQQREKRSTPTSHVSLRVCPPSSPSMTREAGGTASHACEDKKVIMNGSGSRPAFDGLAGERQHRPSDVGTSGLNDPQSPPFPDLPNNQVAGSGRQHIGAWSTGWPGGSSSSPLGQSRRQSFTRRSRRWRGMPNQVVGGRDRGQERKRQKRR